MDDATLIKLIEAAESDKFENLKKLDLSDNKITDTGGQHILDFLHKGYFPQLVEINFRGNKGINRETLNAINKSLLLKRQNNQKQGSNNLKKFTKPLNQSATTTGVVSTSKSKNNKPKKSSRN